MHDRQHAIATCFGKYSDKRASVSGNYECYGCQDLTECSMMTPEPTDPIRDHLEGMAAVLRAAYDKGVQDGKRLVWQEVKDSLAEAYKS